MTLSDQSLAQYLFGELSDAEQSELEARYFEEREIFERLVQYETDLLDDYARDRLSPSMRQRFEKAYLSDPERRGRLRFSQALVKQIDPVTKGFDAASEAGKSWWQKFLGPAASGSRILAFSVATLLLMLCAASVWLFLRSRRLRDEMMQMQASQSRQEQLRRELEQELSDQAAKNRELSAELERERTAEKPPLETPSPQRVTPSFASLTLVISGLRGPETTAPTLTIPPGTAEVHIQLRLTESLYQSYQLELQAVGGAGIFSRSHVTPKSTKSGAVLGFSLPASKLAPGDYILTLKGVTASGATEDVSQSLFRVKE